MASIADVHKKLMAEWSKAPETRNLNTIDQIMRQLKAMLLQSDQTSGVAESQMDKIEGDLLEIDALLVILQNNADAFDDAMGRLKQYYRINPLEGKSQKAIHMLGLDLMHLLAQNQRSRFHMELERIARDTVANNKYLSIPIKLEQYLMEGAYNKVFLSEKDLPSPYYLPFYKIMLETVRTEIACSIEKAYPKLSTEAAAQMLFYKGPNGQNDAIAFGKTRSWSYDPTKKSFVFRAQDLDQTSMDGKLLDTDRLIRQNIFYAKQLEMIV